MSDFSFSISTKRFMGEDLTLVVKTPTAAEIPAVALTLTDRTFPLSLQEVAASILSLLNGHEPIAMNAGDPILYRRGRLGFDLHCRYGGKGVSIKGLEVRKHATKLPDEVRSYLDKKLIPVGDQTDFARQLCHAIRPAAKTGDGVAAPKTRSPDSQPR